VRDGNNVNYDIDNLSNRYDSVGGNTLAYDAAGNLTTDEDGYQYEYDYENRIVRITDVNDANVAEYSYDALGRRIEKKDCITSANTRRYYYNDNWQILCEYNAAGTYIYQWFAYGNYIDEVLMRSQSLSHTSATLCYYVHDHLYSPVALVQRVNSLVLFERYEYDAYGNCYVLEPNFAPDPDNKTDYGNPYQFTGRSLDVLDGGLLRIMQYRHRYYGTYTGRFTTHDPLGITPNAPRPNQFYPLRQTSNELNIYAYAEDNPIVRGDPTGLQWFPWPLPAPPRPRIRVPDAVYEYILPFFGDQDPMMLKHIISRCRCKCGLGGLSALRRYGRIMDKALRRADKMFKDRGGGGYRAMRHCLASGMVADLVGCKCAACVGDEREKWQSDTGNQGPRERLVADIGNLVGRTCYGCKGKNADEDRGSRHWTCLGRSDVYIEDMPVRNFEALVTCCSRAVDIVRRMGLDGPVDVPLPPGLGDEVLGHEAVDDWFTVNQM